MRLAGSGRSPSEGCVITHCQVRPRLRDQEKPSRLTDAAACRAAAGVVNAAKRAAPNASARQPTERRRWQ